MLARAQAPRPWIRTASRSFAAHLSGSDAPAGSLSRPRPTAPQQVPVDQDCIPLAATYSISDFLPATSPSLAREALVKLHRLAALEPPTTELGWQQLQDLDELVAIVQAVQDVDTSVLGLKPGAMVDARVRAEPEPVDWTSSGDEESAHGPDVGGRDLLKLAERTEGAYYVAPMPENVRTRKRSVSSASDADEL
ncbi:hypothetical protein BMF94_7004 [Rhodotorula taiwanensis]|uniref:Uncharacterized protein n=1 Tax=Rhodotorula taiwanensis TaxID=741276 RepID=A0A2S5AZQ9_9BASI|nr:hypothetical protein BMF94_7004 [Rhodotorula taiwanensis]